MRFSLQCLELVKKSQVLLWILVERMAFVEIDVTRVSGIVASSTPEPDPVPYSKQWPELFKSGRDLF